MFEKEAEEYAKENKRVYGSDEYADITDYNNVKKAFQKGAEFGYKKANEWHKVSEKLPEMDEFVFIWNNIGDFPIVACRHIPYEKKEWVWDCKWGSGYTVSQSVAEKYLWREIVPPKE